MPRVESRLMLLEPIARRGVRLFELACEHDLEGIVAKWAKGSYQCEGCGTSWLKIKNPDYSHELFEKSRLRVHRGPPNGPRPDPGGGKRDQLGMVANLLLPDDLNVEAGIT
jgi:hypothetical protein